MKKKAEERVGRGSKKPRILHHSWHWLSAITKIVAGEKAEVSEEDSRGEGKLQGRKEMARGGDNVLLKSRIAVIGGGGYILEVRRRKEETAWAGFGIRTFRSSRIWSKKVQMMVSINEPTARKKVVGKGGEARGSPLKRFT